LTDHQESQDYSFIVDNVKHEEINETRMKVNVSARFSVISDIVHVAISNKFHLSFIRGFH